MAQVKQWVSQQNGLEQMVVTETTLPRPGKDEVLVEIHAVSLNYRDIEVAMGLYNHHKVLDQNNQSDIVPCSDMCGTIIEIGEGADANWKIGDRVISTFAPLHQTGQITPTMLRATLGLPLNGVLTTYRLFTATGLVKAPSHMSDEEACTLPIAALTAWMSINGMRPFGQPGGRGEIILFQGTGGVSIAGLQMAVSSGAKVIITSSSDEKLLRAKQLGATHTINYRDQKDWEQEVLQYTSDEGVDIILETGGAQTLRKSFDCIKFGGLINCIGYLSGKEDAEGDRLNVNVLALRRNVTLKGIINGPKDRLEEMIAFYERHGIHPVVDKTFPFEQSKEAFQYLYHGNHFGKVVIKVKET